METITETWKGILLREICKSKSKVRIYSISMPQEHFDTLVSKPSLRISFILVHGITILGKVKNLGHYGMPEAKELHHPQDWVYGSLAVEVTNVVGLQKFHYQVLFPSIFLQMGYSSIVNIPKTQMECLSSSLCLLLLFTISTSFLNGK